LGEAGEVKEEDEEAFVAEGGFGSGFEVFRRGESGGGEGGGRGDGDGGEDLAAELLIFKDRQGDGFAVLEDAEVVFGEAADGFAVLPLNGDIDDDELGAGLKLELLTEEGGEEEESWKFAHFRNGT
jgi:hypothetical protein